MKHIKININFEVSNNTNYKQRELLQKKIEDIANFVQWNLAGFLDKDGTIKFEVEDNNSYPVGEMKA